MTGGQENRLEKEKSPYLRQHATNPVDWYPWGEEAFARAKGEGKPVFLSIGYATCHWCHVMAHESFADEGVAALLNAGFVSIKVDREERPDIDGIYMQACQLLTGSGGWPLTIVMTPDKTPFFAATYIPKESRWGRTGLLELLPRIGDFWRTKRSTAEAAARQTVALLSRPRETAKGGETAPEALLEGALEEFRNGFDETWGGFGEAPKFPMAHQLVFLLRRGRHGGGRPLEMALKTLRAIRRGGIFDQLGFGFHRYSTDRQWLVPHFEKMLYDQALLTLACTEAFQATGEEAFARTAREVIAYVLRDLAATEGGFYAAEDADSEGEEGRFYLWRQEDFRRFLDDDDAAWAATRFGLSEAGNFVDPLKGTRTGDNILWLPERPAGSATGAEPARDDEARRWEAVRRRLLAARERRVRPQRDEKILTDWNGLMIAALARAARVFNEPSYQVAARQAADFLLSRLRTVEGRLLHRYCAGEAAIGGHLDDYAFLIWGLLESYETDFVVADLRAALDLQRVLDERFRDLAGGYFFTPDDGEALPLRLKEGYDGAIPSGNAVTLINLIRLGRMTGDPHRQDEAAKMVRAFAGEFRLAPTGHAQWLVGLDLLTSPSCEVVIAGPSGSPAVEAMLTILRRRYDPGLTVLYRPEGDAALAAIAPFTGGMGMVGGRAAAYLCSGFACRPPVTDPGQLAALLAAADIPPPGAGTGAPEPGSPIS